MKQPQTIRGARRVLVCAAVWLLGAGLAQANLLTNGSFEDTGGTFVGDVNHVDELISGSTAIPGWTTINGVPTAWIENGNPYGISASNGDFFLDFTGYSNSGTYGGVTQSVTGLTAGGKYALTFDLGYGGNSALFGGPATVRVSVGGSSMTFTSDSGTPNPAVWDSETFDFTATSSAETLSILGISTAGGFYIGLDNADLEPGGSAPVPEPGMIGLFGAGLVGLVWRSSRQPRRVGSRSRQALR
jgi:hypothetical protein